jgi:4,5-DOPA dioxygenase extradiol
MHIWPDHDVPVVQVSLQPGLGTAHHVALGRALAPLASEGVMIIGSGHTTHNLRDWIANRRRTDPMRYAQDFTSWVQATLEAQDTDALVEYRERAPSAERSHPTEEHFLPLHVAWGAAGERPRAERIVSGFEAGALALDSWLFHA